jgi:hypothetical protein
MIIYLDDILIMAESPTVLLQHLATTQNLLSKLGFEINTKKSLLHPTRQLRFLGFDIDTKHMSLHLPSDKARVIRRDISKSLSANTISIRALSSLIGKLNAVTQAILPARLQHRYLLQDKIQALRSGLHYDQVISLSQASKDELQWWLDNLKSWNGRSLLTEQAVHTLTTDASQAGWGAFTDSTCTNGAWTDQELNLSINARELLAVEYGLRSLLPQVHNQTVQVLSDNITTIAHINKMGGTHSPPLLHITKRLWLFCLKKRIFLQASYIPGVSNQVADRLSRENTSDMNDWQLHPKVFRKLYQVMGPFTVDLFASRVTAQLPQFVSWKPDPYALATDAFSISWTHQFNNGYANPPFCLIEQVLHKVIQDHSTIVLIAPLWPSRPYFPLLLNLICDSPRLLPPSLSLLRPPPGLLSHHITRLPPRSCLNIMVAWKLSGNTSRVKDYHQTLSHFWRNQSSHPQPVFTTLHGGDGFNGALKGQQQIPVLHL